MNTASKSHGSEEDREVKNRGKKAVPQMETTPLAASHSILRSSRIVSFCCHIARKMHNKKKKKRKTLNSRHGPPPRRFQRMLRSATLRSAALPSWAWDDGRSHPDCFLWLHSHPHRRRRRNHEGDRSLEIDRKSIPSVSAQEIHHRQLVCGLW